MQAFKRFRNKQKIDKVNRIENKFMALRNQNMNIILFIQYID